MVHDIVGEADWDQQLTKAGGKLVVVDFSATWCGPCKFIKPIFHQMSSEYSDVVFLAVDEGQNRQLIQSLGIRGFPTFHFYINKRKMDEMVGADPNSLRNKIETLRQQTFNPFSGGGMTLGSTAAGEDPREARLRKLQSQQQPPAAPALGLSEDEQLAKAIAMSQQETPQVVCDGDTCTLVPPTTPAPTVNEELLSQLLDMGFPDIRARKSLLATQNSGLEASIAWIEEHQDDADIDEPIKQADVSKPMTAEEREQKVAAMKQKIQERKLAREKEEQDSKKMSELQRREMGQQMSKAREEYASTQRKLEAEKARKEKIESKKERDRLRLELAKDKAERMVRMGLTPPPINQLLAEAGGNSSVKSSKPTVSLTPRESVKVNIEKLKKYRVANDGLTALKTLNVYVKNLVEKPEEEKFRTINLENAVFKKRVSAFVGGIALLRALGYEKNEENQTLHMTMDNRDVELLQYARTELARGIQELS